MLNVECDLAVAEVDVAAGAAEINSEVRQRIEVRGGAVEQFDDSLFSQARAIALTARDD